MASETNWTVLTFAFLGGSMASYLLTKLLNYWARPIIKVYLAEERGSYVTTERGNPRTHQAKFLRLLIENDGQSTLKDCAAYITHLERVKEGQRLAASGEVFELAWSHSSSKLKSLPTGAFFHIDIISLELLSTGGVLCPSGNFPNSLKDFFLPAAIYSLTVRIFADNAAAIEKIVTFAFDPTQNDLRVSFDT